MKKKSILIASLSLGLIFGIANTPTYASANEITQEQKDEFHRRKTDEVLAQLKAKDKDAQLRACQAVGIRIQPTKWVRGEPQK